MQFFKIIPLLTTNYRMRADHNVTCFQLLTLWITTTVCADIWPTEGADTPLQVLCKTSTQLHYKVTIFPDSLNLSMTPSPSTSLKTGRGQGQGQANFMHVCAVGGADRNPLWSVQQSCCTGAEFASCITTIVFPSAAPQFLLLWS